MGKYCFTLLLVLASFFAKAHPHVFIETSVTVVYAQTSIEKLAIKYEFDAMFSTDLIQAFDKNKNNKFEQTEVTDLFNNAFSNLKEYNYFIHVVDGGKKLTFSSVNNFKAIIKDGKVLYYFDIKTNINTKTPKKVKIAAYDHSYYIDVGLLQKNVRFKNSELATFDWKLIEDPSMAFYFDQLYPPCAVITFK